MQHVSVGKLTRLAIGQVALHTGQGFEQIGGCPRKETRCPRYGWSRANFKGDCRSRRKPHSETSFAHQSKSLSENN